MVEQALQGGTHLVEGRRADDRRPLLFDSGYSVAGVGHHGASPVGEADEFGASVSGVWLTLEVAEVLEVVDQLGGGGQAQLRSGSDVGESHLTHADRAEDLQVRVANVAVACRSGGRGQFASEFAQQPDQQLADGQPIGGQIS